MKTRSTYLAALAMMFFFSIFIGCSGGGGTQADSTGTASTAALRIVATDAPFSFNSVKSATVEIQRIELHEATDDVFLTVAEFPDGKELDLVRLRNGVTETLFEGNPPPGTYDAVRIIVHPREILIDDNGTERTFIDFKVPSGPQTGIKIFIEPAINVTTTLTTDLVLDFDLSRSFVVQGNPATPAGIKGFLFKPVIRAVNSTVAGTLTFLVRSDNGTTEEAEDDFPLNGAAFTLTDQFGVVFASGSSGINPVDATIEGYVFHPAIPAGDYKLTLEAAGYDPFEAPVTIQKGNLTDLGVILMARTLGMITGTVTTQIIPLEGETLIFAVPEALVAAGGISTLTDNAGAYQLAGLPTGTHDLTISTKTGYETLQSTGTSAPASDPPVTSDFTLVPLEGTVTGTVTTGAENVPVADATVRATMDFGGNTYVIAEATTNAEGMYELTLPTGSYNLVAVKGDASSVPVLVDIVGAEGGDPYDVPLNM
jgi:hypothetical protein